MRGPELITWMNDLQILPGCLAIWSLGQMGFAVKGEQNVVLYIDPYLSDSVEDIVPVDQKHLVRRTAPAPLTPAEVTNASAVLCSHEHQDHTDVATLGPLAAASPQAHFVGTGWSLDLFRQADIVPQRVTVPKVGEPLRLGNIVVHTVPAAHYQVEEDAEKGHRWLSFLIQWNGVTLFHGGDTLLYPGYLDKIAALPKADVGILATNGRDAVRDLRGVIGNLWPEEAVYAVQKLGWDLFIAGHNDLFPGNIISPGYVADTLARANPPIQWQTLRAGQLLYYIKPGGGHH